MKFNKFYFKIKFYGNIYIFKNYIIIIFLIKNFQFLTTNNIYDILYGEIKFYHVSTLSVSHIRGIHILREDKYMC